MTVARPVAKLVVGFANDCQRGAESGRGNVVRVSGSASRARRRLSNSGGVARHSGRLKGQVLQSWCLRNPYASGIICEKFGRGWTT